MKRFHMRHFVAILSLLFVFQACASKNPSTQNPTKVGVATIVGGSGGAVLGGLTGGMLGILISGGSGGAAPLIGTIVGAVYGGTAGYGLGQVIEN